MSKTHKKLSAYICDMKVAHPEELSKGSILTSESHKIAVSNSHHEGEYLSTITYLLPFNLSGVNVCDNSTPSCRAICLGYKSGHADMIKQGENMNDTRLARLRRVWLMTRYNKTFMRKLVKELTTFCKRAHKKGVTPVYRFNGSSDLEVENFTMENGENMIEYFGREYGLIAYDYTKSLSRALKYVKGEMPTNYHLTFSYTPETVTESKIALDAGVNVAVAFDTKDKNDFLGKRFLGSTIIDGDLHDLRFTDPQGGYIVGLTKKGRHKGDFFVDPNRTEPQPMVA
jgi:hypothetical protein